MKAEKQKICAVICEFNPFHSGHAHLVAEIKKILPEFLIVAIMSGDFVQRAEPAIFDKYARAETAIKNGFSAVIQLPTIYSVASAERFALGGVGLAKSIGAEVLAFGCENPDIDILNQIAEIELMPSETYSSHLKLLLDSGISYAHAISKSCAYALKNNKIIDILSKPNNLLAIEYLKAAKKLGYYVRPLPILRVGSNYNDTDINSEFPSASALRKALRENTMPNGTQSLTTVADYGLFDKLATLSLKLASTDKISLAPDCSEGLEYKIKKAALISNDLDSIIQKSKSKRYLYARIKRIAVQVMLDISKQNYLNEDSPARVLAFKKDSRIMSHFKYPIFVKNSELPVTNPSIQTDITAALISTLIHNNPSNPLSRKPFII